MFKKVTVFALLFVLVLASFPTYNVFAKDAITEKMDAKWDQLVSSYNTQAYKHEQIHKTVENYLKTGKNIKASAKTELERHLAICNSALDTAKAIVNNHPGFDAKGNMIDRAVAEKTLKTLANILAQHAGSVRNLKAHMNMPTK